MFKIKFPLLLLMLFVLQGCFPSSHYYILSTPSSSKSVKYPKSIGVERITLPKYLSKREIAVAHSSSKIAFLSDAIWAEELGEGLTQRMIYFFHKHFSQANVSLYPWNMTQQPDLKVKIKIMRFIAYQGSVYLDGNWEIERMKRKTYHAKRFHIKVKTKHDSDSIVASMDKAFAKLEQEVADVIQRRYQ